MDEERVNFPQMTFYRETYKNSRKWNGEDLTNKRIIIYCEQGCGDVIMAARYFNLPGKVDLHCDKKLHTLFSQYETIDKEDDNLPDHDYHVLSLTLPFLVEESPIPYISVESDYMGGIGIAWEGNPDHEYNLQRSCHLSHFKPLGKVIMLQDRIYLPELFDESVELFGKPLNDFLDTAKLINSLDVVVTVDTSVLHLAGAMGKKGFGLLNYVDERWKRRNWYPSIKLLKGDWDSMIKKVLDDIRNK